MATVVIRASNGKYVVADQQIIKADRAVAGAWEQFDMQDLGNGDVALQSWQGNFVSVQTQANSHLVANSPTIGATETFAYTDLGQNTFTLRCAANGLYVCADGSGTFLVADRQNPGPWETFTIANAVILSPHGYGPDGNLPVPAQSIGFDVLQGQSAVIQFRFPSTKEAAVLIYMSTVLNGSWSQALAERGNYARSNTPWTYPNNGNAPVKFIATGWFKEGPPSAAKPWIEAIQVVGNTTTQPGGIPVLGADFRDVQLHAIAGVDIVVS